MEIWQQLLRPVVPVSVTRQQQPVNLQRVPAAAAAVTIIIINIMNRLAQERRQRPDLSFRRFLLMRVNIRSHARGVMQGFTTSNNT